jgi:hypothetical protein
MKSVTPASTTSCSTSSTWPHRFTNRWPPHRAGPRAGYEARAPALATPDGSTKPALRCEDGEHRGHCRSPASVGNVGYDDEVGA